jgi:hypothetical protein
MRSIAIALLLALSSTPAVPVGAAEPASDNVGPAHNAATLQFLAWNRSGVAVDLEVRLNGETVLREQVPSSDIPSAISAGTVIQRPLGKYSFEVVDHTRNLKQAADVGLTADGPNFGVYLIPEQLALVLTDQRLPSFAPGVVTGNGR